MIKRLRQYSAPILVLIVILILWETLVTVFKVQQFLLPKPTVIVSNLLQLVVLSPAAAELPQATDIEATLKGSKLFVIIPQNAPEKIVETLRSNKIFQLPILGYTFILMKGPNLAPIVQAALYTLRGALGGFVVGCGLGILTAMLTARWTTTREAFMPFAIAVNSMPIIAFAPIMNNWFGIDNPVSKIAIVALMTFFPMMINTVRGLTLIDAQSLEMMRSYAANDFEVLFKLRIPSALPYVFNGFKISAALSMIGAVVGEYFGGPRIALGVFITQEAALFRFASAWAAIIVACILGIILYLLILAIERWVMPWHVSFR
jgi:NitT/TauT family transport system permease protein